MAAPIKILSLGWRSHWLANRLNTLGFDVELYELTEHTGWTHPQDIDGPFPFSISNKSPMNFVNLSQVEEAVELLQKGFCLSCPDGHLAWQAPNKKDVVQNFRKVFKEDYPLAQTFWLEDGLHSFACTEFRKTEDWSQEEERFQLNRPLYIKRSDRSSYSTSLELLAERGVRVYSVQGEELSGVLSQVQKDPSDWIVALTVSELKILTDSNKKEMQNQMAWHRKRFFYDEDHLTSLPSWSLWLESYAKPWKEENYYILVKGQNELYIDVWSLEHIYKRETKERSLHQAGLFLERNFPYLSFSAQESDNLEGLLKSLFPVNPKTKVKNDRSYLWNSPLEWGSFSEDRVFAYQSHLATVIQKNGIKQAREILNSTKGNAK